MIRPAAAALMLAAISLPAHAITFDENEQGQIEFAMPSGNIGCIYTPAGGTDVYEPVGGGPELACERIEPTFVRVIMGPSGKARRYDIYGDTTCCTAENIFRYGEVWRFDGFRCTSSTSGLTCRRGAHGFSMSRKAIRTW